MRGVNVRYARELRKEFGYSATWVPTVQVRLGDVGVLHNWQFERVRSVHEFGIDFKTRNDTNTGFLRYVSSGAVNVAIKASGTVPDPGSALAVVDGGITVSFGSEGAVLFQASDCITRAIDDVHAIGEELLSRYEAGDWPEDYVVVTEVLRAERATILVSHSKDASIEFRAGANVTPSEVSLVDAGAGLSVARSRNVGTQIVGEGGLTPLFKAAGVRKRFLRPARFDRRGASEADGPSPLRPIFFGEVDYSNFDRDL